MSVLFGLQDAPQPQSVVARLMTTGDRVISNTTNEMSGLPQTGYGDNVLRSDELSDGKAFRVMGRGFYSTFSVLPTLTVRVKLGSVVLASTNVTGLLLSANGVRWGFDADVQIRANGIVQCEGRCSYAVDVIGTIAEKAMGGQVSIPTLGQNDQLLDVTLQWSSGNPANSITTTISRIERIGLGA